MSIALAIGGMLAACAGGFFGFRVHVRRKTRARLREKFLATQLPQARETRGKWSVSGYMETLTRKLYTGSSRTYLSRSSNEDALKTRAGRAFQARMKSAGLEGKVSAVAFCETRNRFCVTGLAAGLLVGGILSPELAVVLGICGALAFRTAPDRALRDAQSRRSHEAERCLSEMLEVVALGLRSGLTFDRSFELYGQHFSSEFAQACSLTYRRWALGLSTREEALAALAESYDCEQLARIVDTIVRGLRMGTALAGSLEEAATQSRASHRAAVEERVAKAPVKMMVPTGTLILPAMLLLVLGPILLELANGF